MNLALLLVLALPVVPSGAAPPAPCPVQKSDEAAALRAFRRAYRPERRADQVYEARREALEALAASDSLKVAETLLDGYLQLEKEAFPILERRRKVLESERRDKTIERRPELDPLHRLQDALSARLVGLADPAAVRRLVERALTDDKLPLGLRLDLVERAVLLEDEGRALVSEALAKTRKPAAWVTALAGVEVLGPDAQVDLGAVLRALEHSNGALRAAAVEALVRLERPESIEPLIARLAEERGGARERVHRALQALTGQTIGPSPEAWRRWLADHGALLAGDGAEPTPSSAPATGEGYYGLPLDGRSILFVFDRSLSMRKSMSRPKANAGDGEESREDRMKRELVRALGRLTPDKQFGLIAFADRPIRFAPELLPASEENVLAAQDWVREMDLVFGTALYDALDLTFAVAGRGVDESPYDAQVDTVFVLTDGAPYVGNTPDDFSRILSAARRWNRSGQVALHVIGLGDGIPKANMQKLAEENGGRFVHEKGEGAPEEGDSDEQRGAAAGRRRAQTVAPVPPERPVARPPNVVFVMADDLGWGELGCYGQTRIRTPSIDRLAAEGLRFTDFYSGSPVCAPSRCVLLTGKHTGHAFIRGNRGQPEVGQEPIADEVVTLAELLRPRGYLNAGTGKWGLGGPGTSGLPNLQGFDRWFGYLDQWNAHDHYPDYLWRDDVKVPLPENAEGVNALYSHDLFSQEALDFLGEQDGERPFFLYVAYAVPHVSLQVPGDSLAEYAEAFPETPFEGGHYAGHATPRAAYAAMVTRMDRDVGRMLDLLDERGLAKDTLFVFTSDNGPTYAGGADSKFFDSAGPFRGLKGSLYEGGIRVPFVARWPGRVAAGTESAHVAGMWDVLPTLGELAGAEIPADVDGISFAPTLTGEGRQREHEVLYREYPAAGWSQAVRTGRWKAVRRKIESGESVIELYDLAADPAESRDLAAEHPERVARAAELFRSERVPSPLWPQPLLDAVEGR